jgi:hypothetical protein
MNAIIWPEGYVPGYTENFVLNEVIVTGLSAADVWPLLSTPHHGADVQTVLGAGRR